MQKYLTHELIRTYICGKTYYNDFICLKCNVLLYAQNQQYYKITSCDSYDNSQIFTLTCDEVIIQKIIE